MNDNYSTMSGGDDLTIDGWQLVALVSVHGRGSLLDVDSLLHLAFQPVLFSV